MQVDLFMTIAEKITNTKYTGGYTIGGKLKLVRSTLMVKP